MNIGDTSCSGFISRLEPPYNPEDRAPGYRVELSVTSDLGTEVRTREILAANIDGLWWQESFYASEFWAEANQWPYLGDGYPTFILTGYALPDGPGGPLGASETISATISLAGCGGGGIAVIAPQY